MNSQIVTVNLIPGLSAPAVVRVSQYDYGRPIVFNILDGTKAATIDSSATITVVGTKPSGLGFSETALTISGGAVTLNTTLAMTQESGLIPAEIRIEKQGSGNVGTANFILAVEKTTHADGTTDGTQETMANLETRLQGQIDSLDSRVDALEAGQGGGSGLTQAEKQLILTLFSKAAYAESDASTAYDALETLWAVTTRTVTYNLSHVTSSNTASSVDGGSRYTTTLTATGSYSINSVTVTMGGVDITSTAYSSGTVSISSVTGNIVITATAVLAAQSITATYTQSGTVYDTDSLDSLKADLVVTANYSGGTSETVPASNYTLSGTLTVGTSIITVEYAGLTDTFDVTVTHEEEVLHQLSARNITINSTNSIAVEDVDRITHTTGSNSQSAYIKSNGTAHLNVTPISQWFGLNSGDSYVFRIKNIAFSDNNNDDNYFAVALKNDSSTTKVTSGNINVSQTGSGTVSDVEITGTMSENVANVTLFSFVYRAMVISYDVELYVNGERYV